MRARGAGVVVCVCLGTHACLPACLPASAVVLCALRTCSRATVFRVCSFACVRAGVSRAAAGRGALPAPVTPRAQWKCHLSLSRALLRVRAQCVLVCDFCVCACLRRVCTRLCAAAAACPRVIARACARRVQEARPQSNGVSIKRRFRVHSARGGHLPRSRASRASASRHKITTRAAARTRARRPREWRALAQCHATVPPLRRAPTAARPARLAMRVARRTPACRTV